MPATSPMLRRSIDVRQSAQRVHRVGPVRLQRRGALEQPLAAIQVERREPGGRRERMSGVRVAVKELDAGRGAVDDGVVDRAAHAHRAHRHRRVRDALRQRHHVRHDAELLGGERRAESAEARDHFVEDEQNAVACRRSREGARGSPWAE